MQSVSLLFPLQKWAEVSGLVFSYLSGPVTPRQANILLLTSSTLNEDEAVLASAQEPNPFGSPPTSKIWIDSTENRLKAFGTSPGEGKSPLSTI